MQGLMWDDSLWVPIGVFALFAFCYCIIGGWFEDR